MDQHHQAAQLPDAAGFGHLIAADNLTLTAAPSHPSYAEMITAAIGSGSGQSRVGGVSKRGIAKYIDRVYTDLPLGHSVLLTHHLTRLHNSGHLFKFKNSYLLASNSPPPPLAFMESQSLSPPPPVNPSPKRGPGRPSKLKSTPDPAFGDRPKKRGRPPKQLPLGAAEVPFVEPISEARPTEKRRPGRPPKPQEVPFAQPVASDEGAVVKRRAGRPPKAGRMVWPVGVGRPRGRPKKSAIGLGPASRPIGKQPRGRPRKLGGGVGMVTMKGRGRPPKGSSPRKPRRLSGKPLGRPRKGQSYQQKHLQDASAVRNQTSKQGQGMINEELTKKLELIQLKIQDAAGIIRPYIVNENEALMALQQLQELATTTSSEPPAMSIAPPPAPQPINLGVDPSPTAPNTAAPSPAIGSAPVPVPGAFFGIPGTFSVNLPALNTEPFHAPSGMESQQPMSWLPSGGTQS